MWDGLSGFTPEQDWRVVVSSHIFIYLFYVLVCVCPPICVGLAGGQSNGELEKLDVALYTSVLSL